MNTLLYGIWGRINELFLLYYNKSHWYLSTAKWGFTIAISCNFQPWPFLCIHWVNWNFGRSHYQWIILINTTSNLIKNILNTGKFSIFSWYMCKNVILLTSLNYIISNKFCLVVFIVKKHFVNFKKMFTRYLSLKSYNLLFLE